MARLLCLALLLLTASQVIVADRRGLWEVDRELDDMLDYLEKYGYTTLRNLLKKHDLDHALMELLQKGTQITLLAPTNDAFVITPNCGLDVKEVLLDHVIPELMTEREIKDADVGTKVQSVGKDLVEKSDNRPIKVKLAPGKHHKGNDKHDNNDKNNDHDNHDNHVSHDSHDKSHERRHLEESHDTIWPATHADVSTSKAAPVHKAAKGHHQKGGHHAAGHGHHQEKHVHKSNDDRKHNDTYLYASEAEITYFYVWKSKNILVHRIDHVLTLCPKKY